jgi:hypothetical protein
MTDPILAAAENQPTVKLIFNPNEQVKPDATQIDGAFWIVPANFTDTGTAGSDAAYKALLGDGSGSMLEHNKRNDCVAGMIQALTTSVGPDDYFAVYSFDTVPRRLFPLKGKPVKGTPENIRLAIAACQALAADGYTFMSKGIDLVFNDFLSLPDCDEGVCCLISDGMNDPKDERGLSTSLARIGEYRNSGKILKVQPIGVGPEISQAQLSRIVEETLADPVYHIRTQTGSAVWADTFARIFNDLSAKKLRSVTISFVDKPTTTTLLQFSQQRPTALDLTHTAVVGKDEQSITFQIGGWESHKRRLYSFSLGVRKPTRDNLLAAYLQIAFKIGRKSVTIPPVPIKVRWTNVVGLSARIPAELAEARGITGSVEAISEGIKALERHDKDTARKHFQKAYDLAREVNDTRFIRDLGDFVEIDETTHTVKVKALTREDSNRLESLSKRREAD